MSPEERATNIVRAIGANMPPSEGWKRMVDEIREAIAEEREACAQEAEVGRAGGERPYYADEIAAAIRARP